MLSEVTVYNLFLLTLRCFHTSSSTTVTSDCAGRTLFPPQLFKTRRVVACSLSVLRCFMLLSMPTTRCGQPAAHRKMQSGKSITLPQRWRFNLISRSGSGSWYSSVCCCCCCCCVLVCTRVLCLSSPAGWGVAHIQAALLQLPRGG